MRMALFLNIVYLIALLCASPWMAWRYCFQQRYRNGKRQKWLGIGSLPAHSGPTVWLHAVSVGEVQVLRILVEKFQAHRPDVRLVISASTDAGNELARKLFSQHIVFYAPFDFFLQA
jgi:3-deoxy-D-manno-octulosonic-acid transferase